MRKITNKLKEDYSVETADGGFHAIRSGETETVDVNEHKVDYYREKGFDVGELIEEVKEPAKEPAKDGQEPPAQPPAQPAKDSQPAAKNDGKADKPADKAGAQTGADGVQIIK